MANVTSACRIYVLSFQVDDLTQVSIVRGWLRDSPIIESAMAPVGITFYFKSYKEVAELRSEMRFLFPNGKFIISQTNIFTIDGSAPQSVWSWFVDNNDGNENEIKNGPFARGLLISQKHS